MIDPGYGSEGTAHRTKLLAAVRRVLGAAFLLASLAGGVAISPPVGSEVLLTDADGGRFVGYGTVTDSGLRIELSEDIRDLRVVVVTPDGASQPYGGRWNGETLTLTDTSGSEVDLADELAEDGRLLSLAWPDGRNQVVMPGAASDEAADVPTEDVPAQDVPAQDEAPGKSPADVGADQAGAGDEPGRSADAPGRGDDDGDRDTPAVPDPADRDDRDDDGQDDGRPDLPDPDLPEAAPDVPARGGPDRDDGRDGRGDEDDADEGDAQDDDGDGGVEADVDADADGDGGVGAEVDVGVGNADDRAAHEDESDDDPEQDDADESNGDEDDEDEDGSSGAVDLNLP